MLNGEATLTDLEPGIREEAVTEMPQWHGSTCAPVLDAGTACRTGDRLPS